MPTTESGSVSAAVDGDAAQRSLTAHLAATEVALRQFLRTLDHGADCRITPAADVGPPYDALRLWGGFATGCLVQWDCSVPVVPVDVTMNIDTTSVFELAGDPGPILDATAMSAARRKVDSDSSYIWNFDSGNHFISLTRSQTGWALVLHSNEKEFKDQYNGLYPSAGNWYARQIQTSEGNRPIRLLVGDDAVTFFGLAEMLVPFNRLRHRLIAQLILDGASTITGEWHKEHYYMPTSSSAAIGAFLCEPNERGLVFSATGMPLMWFEPKVGGMNEVGEGEGKQLVVPHGWGMTADELDISVERERLVVNGHELEPALGVSLFDGLGIRQRTFASNQAFVDAIQSHTPGRVVEELAQIESYSRFGYLRHE